MNHVQFSPDGQRLATVSADHLLKLWDLTTGLEVLNLGGHSASVHALSFSPDSLRIATAGEDRTIRVWDGTPPTPDLINERDAASMVKGLAAKPLLRSEMRAAIEKDVTIGEAVRGHALALVETYHGDGPRMNNAAWSVVRQAQGAPADYQRAFDLAEAACQADALNPSFYNTRGVALYRLGRFPEAIEALSKADRLATERSNESHPTNLAFLGMAHHRLGHDEQARAFLSRAREALATPRWAANQDLKSFVREAESLLAK